MKNYKSQKGSVIISILILFVLVFSTAFYISKDLLDFRKSQVRYELLSSRDLLVEQMKQYMYNPVVIGVSAVLLSENPASVADKLTFRKCVDSTYNNKFAAGSTVDADKRCEELLCSKNDPACLGTGYKKNLKAYSPIGRSGNLNVSKICNETNFENCDYLNITGVDATHPVKYRVDGTPCLEATPGSDCVFWFYAEYICDNKFKGAGNETVPCSAQNQNIFINVTMVHATSQPRTNPDGGTPLAATVGTESLIDKNRINPEDIRLTYIPVSEIRDSHIYLCVNDPAPDCSTPAEQASGARADGCPCNTTKASICIGVPPVCGSADALGSKKCCSCTCPDPATTACGASAPPGCPCSMHLGVCGSPSMSCSDPAHVSGCPCVAGTCDPNLLCTDTNYKAGCPCKVPGTVICPATPLNCNDPSHVAGCPCTETGTCPTIPNVCGSPAAIAAPDCGCSCPTSLVTGSSDASALPACMTTTTPVCTPGLICGTSAANANPGCPCTNPTCGDPADACDSSTPPGCPCRQNPSCPLPSSNICGTPSSDAVHGCATVCPVPAHSCGTPAANAIPGCACQCPGATPTCGRDPVTGIYNVRPIPGCPCSQPPPPPPPPPSGS